MAVEATKTEVGSYFISNYPPFSQWTAEALPRVRTRARFAAAVPAGHSEPAPLGLYLHIPFCRKRCKFCYFRVYTDKNGRRRRDVRLGTVTRNRAGQPLADHGRAAISLRVLRRRNPLVLERQAAHLAGRSAASQHQLGPGRGSHLRVRAGHLVAAQDRNAARNWASRGSAWAWRTSATRCSRRTAGPISRARSTSRGIGSAPPAFPTSTST